jgi:hypothetical protein
MDEPTIGSLQEPPRHGFAWPVPAVYSTLAVMSLASAGIHFAVMGDHFNEYFLFGLFFSVVAWLQALWALGVVVAPTRALLAAGLLGNAVVAVVWVFSRTSGLPIGPEAWTPEPASFLDVLSTVLEVGIVIVIAALLRRGGRTRARNDTRAPMSIAGFALFLVVLTTAAVASTADDAGGHGGHTADGTGLTRVELGEGRTLQPLIDASSGATLMHLTFFDAAGSALSLASLAVTGISESGEEVAIPFQLFEPGHYAATLDLEPGEWSFDIRAAAEDGDDLAASFHVKVD